MQRVKTILGNLLHQAKNIRNWSHKRQAVTGLIVIVLVSVVAVAIKWNMDKKPVVVNSKLSNVQLAQTVNSLVKNKQYDQAQQTLSAQTASQTPENMVLTAQVYYNQKNYKQAEATYEAYAKKYGITASVAANIAQMAQLDGDKPTAITYYQKAITLLQTVKNSSVATNQITAFQAEVKQLQK